MPRYRSGNFSIIAPPEPLETGAVVELHNHDHPHLTYFPMGEWECKKFDVVCDMAGRPKLDAEGHPVELILRQIARKGPGTWLEMDALCWHEFTCLTGPGLYHCLWPSRDPMTGEIVEYYTGWGVS